mmetsp:Transcript_25880/g.71078  ORF Transcript_25880/g.71078 Transcript_25880/m.71078 type:complete len:202 (-) Transcript_25880:1906-2511(-)
MIVSNLWMSYFDGRSGRWEIALPTSSMVTFSVNMYSSGAQSRPLEAFKKAICIRNRPFCDAWFPCIVDHSDELKTTDKEVVVLPAVDADAPAPFPLPSLFLTMVQLSALMDEEPPCRAASLPSVPCVSVALASSSTITWVLHCKNGSSRAAEPPSKPMLVEEEEAGVSSREVMSVDPETPAACMTSLSEASMLRVAERVAG